MLWFLTARTLLKESQVMLFCRRTLCAIVDKPRSVEAIEVSILVVARYVYIIFLSCI
jgi:hypothetical protein